MYTINMEDKYKTACGELEVEILSTTAEFGGEVVYLCPGGAIGRTDIHGHGLAGHPSLVRVGPYDGFKIDDQVEVWETRYLTHHRHFAGIGPNGLVMTFQEGRTSWTNDGRETTEWSNCIKPTEFGV